MAGGSSSSRTPAPDDAIAKLWETVQGFEKGEQDRIERGRELAEQRKEAAEQLEALARESRELEEALRVAQDLEEFALSLAGLLDAKVPKLRQASDTLAQMERDFATRRGRRRRRGMVAALRGAGATISMPLAGDDSDKEAAPPEPRRRSGGREGWDTSSAEEDGLAELAGDRAAFCAAAHKQLAADVSERYTEAASLLEPLRAAKRRLAPGEYVKAFVPVALPEALSMHVEHSLLWWDPLRLCLPPEPEAGSEGGDGAAGDQPLPRWGPRRPVPAVQLERFDWFEALSSFTELEGDGDPDGELVPQIVRRCVFPEVARRLRDCWDVASARQSARAAALLDECLLFETDEAASAFSGLLDEALRRLEQGLAELAPEVFVPADALTKWYASAARWRLLWRCCKIGQCALLLEGRLPDVRLGPFVIKAVFQTRIAPHLRSPRLDPQEMELVERFVSLLPERWLATGLPPGLVPLRDALGPRAPRGPEAAATAAQAARVLRRLRCFDEAQALADGAGVAAA